MQPYRPTRPGPGRPGLPGRGSTGQRPRPAAANNPVPLILGISGGLIVILIILLVSSGGKPPATKEEAETAAPPPAAPKPVDVSLLEREGQLACDEGLRLFKTLEPKIAARDSLSADERHQLKLEVKKSMDLMSKGLGYLSEAAEKSGRFYDTNRYGQAKKLAAGIYLELK